MGGTYTQQVDSSDGSSYYAATSDTSQHIRWESTSSSPSWIVQGADGGTEARCSLLARCTKALTNTVDTGGAAHTGSTFTLADAPTAAAVDPGTVVTGTGIVGTVTVVSITGTTLVLSSSQTLDDDTVLTFTTTADSMTEEACVATATCTRTTAGASAGHTCAVNSGSTGCTSGTNSVCNGRTATGGDDAAKRSDCATAGCQFVDSASTCSGGSCQWNPAASLTYTSLAAIRSDATMCGEWQLYGTGGPTDDPTNSFGVTVAAAAEAHCASPSGATVSGGTEESCEAPSNVWDAENSACFVRPAVASQEACELLPLPPSPATMPAADGTHRNGQRIWYQPVGPYQTEAGHGVRVTVDAGLCTEVTYVEAATEALCTQHTSANTWTATCTGTNDAGGACVVNSGKTACDLPSECTGFVASCAVPAATEELCRYRARTGYVWTAQGLCRNPSGVSSSPPLSSPRCALCTRLHAPSSC